MVSGAMENKNLNVCLLICLSWWAVCLNPGIYTSFDLFVDFQFSGFIGFSRDCYRCRLW